MRKFKMLVLTDHTNHSKENSLYTLVKAMRRHIRCAQLDVATRADAKNDMFFKNRLSKSLYVSKTDESFAFYEDGLSFKKNLRKESFVSYDVVWLRMPPPLSPEFLGFLTENFPNQLIINNPAGIYKTGSKAFLTAFPDLCPPLAICESIEDIIEFKNQFPIVLKPFRDYGGKGILRIDGEKVWEGKKEFSFQELVQDLEGKPIEYLGVKFLKNVYQGDKRIIVVNGTILGASIRLPAKNSWLCNVAMGGHSTQAKPDADEIAMINQLDPVLADMGIVMYGVDTLVGDDGKRVLSELNTTSIGGLPQIAEMDKKPLVAQAVNLMWDYITKKIVEENVISN